MEILICVSSLSHQAGIRVEDQLIPVCSMELCPAPNHDKIFLKISELEEVLSGLWKFLIPTGKCDQPGLQQNCHHEESLENNQQVRQGFSLTGQVSGG